MKQWLAPLIIVTTLSVPTFADDCGEQPMDKPSIPDGATSTQSEIRAARDAVIAYSSNVDKYLQCMDKRSNTIVPYLTKEQKLRWDEDLADIHEVRRELQTKMNAAIRAYRNAIRKGS